MLMFLNGFRKKVFSRIVPLVLILGLLGILTACSDTLLTDNPSADPTAVSESAGSSPSRTAAEGMAAEFVKFWISDCEPGSTGAWTAESRVTDAIPVYNEGLPGVSYWECKVQTEGIDAGFVLVATSDIDMPIPEFSTDGPTPVEQLAARAGTKDFDAYRYGYSGMRALKKGASPDQSRSLDLSTPLAELGVAGLSDLAAVWREKSQENGTVPYYSKTQLTKFRQDQTARALAPSASANAYWAKLANYISSTYDPVRKFPTTQYTHAWTQTWLKGAELPQPAGNAALVPDQKYPLGCGPTAYAIAYAYWKAFRGKSNLFPTITNILNTDYLIYTKSVFYDDFKTMAVHLNTWWRINDEGNPAGGTDIFDMRDQGAKYPRNLGYNNSTVTMYDSGVDQWNLGQKARESLQSNRPPLLTIFVNDKGGAIGTAANHVVVVEEVRKTDYHDSFLGLFWLPWANGSVSYLINLGWGGDTNTYHRWIYTIDVDPAFVPSGVFTSAFQLYDVLVQ